MAGKVKRGARDVRKGSKREYGRETKNKKNRKERKELTRNERANAQKKQQQQQQQTSPEEQEHNTIMSIAQPHTVHEHWRWD